MIKDWKHTLHPVKAVVIEPISFFDHRVAAPTFYQKIREICAEKHLPFIVDESRTGVGITGKYWGHEHWYLENSPDIVIFGRATQVSGFYSKAQFRPKQIHKFSNVGQLDLVKLKTYQII